MLAAMVEVGDPFAVATYQLEGDDPLVFSAYRVFDQLDSYGSEELKLPKTKEACQVAESFIKKQLEPQIQSIKKTHRNISELNTEIQKLEQPATGAPTTATTAARPPRGRRINYQTMASGRAQAEDERRVEEDALLNVELNGLRHRHATFRHQLYRQYQQLDVSKAEIGPQTCEEFMCLAKETIAPVIDAYRGYFLEAPPGPGEKMSDLMRAKKAFKAAKLFDPLHLKTHPPTEGLCLLADDLKYFDFPEFKRPTFIERLKKEIPIVLDLAKRKFNWESIDKSKNYHQRVKKRLKKKRQQAVLCGELQDDGVGEEEDHPLQPFNLDDIADINRYKESHWEDDPGERGRRIYQWWLSWILNNSSEIKFFAHAIRLVALVQPSSAACERVFSQLQYIRHICGDRLLEDLLEFRLLMRCNNKLESSYSLAEDTENDN
jgi:hypothetical protein